MTDKTNKINTSQLCVILLAIFLSMRPIIENSIQAKFVGNDSVITALIAGIINLGLALLICYVIHKNPGKSFLDIIKNLTGETVAKIILFLLGIVFLFKIVLIDYQITFLLHDSIYTEISWDLFTIPVYFILAFIAIKGIRAIARTYQMVVPLSLLMFVAVLLLSLNNANFENLLPLLDHTPSEFINALTYILSQSCSFIFLFTFMENVAYTSKGYYKKIIPTILIILILIESFYILFIAVMGNFAPFVKESLIKMTQFRDSSFGYFKIDIFASLFWIPLIILQDALCVYSISYCLKQSLNIPSYISCIGTVLFLYIIEFIPQINNQTVSYIYFEMISFYVLAFVLLLPVLLVIASFKKEKTK